MEESDDREAKDKNLGNRVTGLHPSGCTFRIASGHGHTYPRLMSTLQEIEAAVSRLKPEELAAFRAWFAAFDAKAWDIEFEHDVAAGRLDKLAEEALEDLREGRCTDL